MVQWLMTYPASREVWGLSHVNSRSFVSVNEYISARHVHSTDAAKIKGGWPISSLLEAQTRRKMAIIYFESMVSIFFLFNQICYRLYGNRHLVLRLLSTISRFIDVYLRIRKYRLCQSEGS